MNRAIAPQAKASPGSPQARSGIFFELNANHFGTEQPKALLSSETVKKIENIDPSIFEKLRFYYFADFVENTIRDAGTFLEGYCAGKGINFKQLVFKGTVKTLIDKESSPIVIQTETYSHDLLVNRLRELGKTKNEPFYNVDQKVAMEAMTSVDNYVKNKIQEGMALRDASEEPITFITSQDILNLGHQEALDLMKNSRYPDMGYDYDKANKTKRQILVDYPELSQYPFIYPLL